MTSTARVCRVVRTVFLLLLVAAPPLSALARSVPVAAKSAIVVNSSGDAADANGSDCTCDTAGVGTVCTLRAAIQTANACAGADVIRFQAAYTITPAAALPGLADTSGGTTISGRGIGVVLDGSLAGDAVGLTLDSDGNEVQGITVTRFSRHNVSIYGAGSVVGTDGDGSDDAAEGNVITLSGQYGIYIVSDNNTIAGNYIGLAANGSDKAANASGGINVAMGSGNIIGTNGDGVSDDVERNVVASNSPTGVGVAVYTTSTPGNTRIAGNYVGTNAAGTAALPDQFMGIYVGQGVLGTVIGTNGDGQGDGAERNVISGIALPGAGGAIKLRSAAVVAGNYLGLNAAGTAALPNFYGILSDVSAGSRIGTNGDGVSDALERNVISGSSNAGISLQAVVDGAVVVAGNYIGTDATGKVAIGNYRGVSLGGTGDWLIGGYSATERNVISGNSLGVAIYGGGAGSQVIGNYIGLAADGVTPLANTQQGVLISSGAASVAIGDMLAGGGNVIAYNAQNGVVLESDDSIAGIAIRGNSIYANGALGIDLKSGSGEGATTNDAGDGDSGANGLQNYPELTAAITSVDGSSSLVSGTLSSAAGATYTLDFYASGACDASGHGEGEVYLGSATTATDAAGNAAFTVALLRSASVGSAVTAVATDAAGNSSEFSACVTAAAAGAGAPAAVSLSGPATGFIGVSYTYVATVEADSASFPLTITWYADGQAQATRTLTSASDAQSLTWANVGAKTVAVIVQNGSGAVSDSLAFAARDAGDNTPPQAVDGATVCIAGASVSGSLMATDADGDLLTYSLVAGASQGTVTITDVNTGAYTYVAAAGAEGSDSFTFRAGDGVAESNVATVSVAFQEGVPEGHSVFVPLTAGG